MTKTVFINNALFRVLCPPVYGVLVYLLVLMANDNISQVQENFFGQEVWFCIGMTYLISEGMRLIIKALNIFYPAETSLKNRIVIQLLVNSLFSIFIVSTVISIYFIYVLNYSTFTVELILINIIYLVSAILYNLLYIGFLYQNIQNTAKLNKENIKTQNLEFQLQSFKNEVNPNLLYSSLETLITLVHQSPEESEDFIDKLSDVYRYLLDNKQNEFNSLAGEITAVDNLLYLLNRKERGNIKFISELDDQDLDNKVVTGTLARLVEFIVGNTIINEHQPLTIHCFLEQDGEYLVLKHRMNDKLILSPQLEEGFKDVQRTFAFFSDKPVMEVKAYGETFIKVPIMNVLEEYI